MTLPKLDIPPIVQKLFSAPEAFIVSIMLIALEQADESFPHPDRQTD